VDKLLNKIDCSSALKDGKNSWPWSAWTAASVVLVDNLICRLQQGLVESRASVKHQQLLTLYLKCILHKTRDRSNRSLNDTMVILESFYYIARWRHWCYKFMHYRVSRCIPNNVEVYQKSRTSVKMSSRYRQSFWILIFQWLKMWHNMLCTLLLQYTCVLCFRPEFCLQYLFSTFLFWPRGRDEWCLPCLCLPCLMV